MGVLQVWAPESRPTQSLATIESYRLAAEDVGGLLFPVAEAWQEFNVRRPDYRLYLDDIHANRAGSYLYEPVGSVHTLFVPSDNTEETEMWSVVYGNTEYLDDNDEVTYVSNWKAMLTLYYEGCETAGLPRPTGILL